MDPTDHADRRDLVLRAQWRDPAAIEQLFLRHNRTLGYYLARMTGKRDVADMQQEIWLTVLRQLRRLREPEAFVAWLYTIARRVAFKRRPPLMAAPLDESLVGELADDDAEFTADDAQAVHEELANLSEPHREVIVLRFMEGMSYEEIARVTDSSVGTVRSRLHYAKAAMRQRWEARHE